MAGNVGIFANTCQGNTRHIAMPFLIGKASSNALIDSYTSSEYCFYARKINLTMLPRTEPVFWNGDRMDYDMALEALWDRSHARHELN